MNLREAAQQAMEALCLPCDRWNRRQTEIINASITALRTALEEQIESKQFMYFESQDGGMDEFMVSSEQDLQHLCGWMKTAGTFDCLHDDQKMVDWMKVADVGEVHFHRLGCLVRLKDKK
jgi:hypothetical protein